MLIVVGLGLIVAGCEEPPPAPVPASPPKFVAPLPPKPLTSAPIPQAAPRTAVSAEPLSKPSLPRSVTVQPAKASPNVPIAAAAPLSQSITPAEAVIDLEGLKKRLRNTDAIGLMTKLSLKGQLDDLVDEFRDYHKGQSTHSITDIREHFNILMAKVISLIQDKDPPLFNEIKQDRESLWAMLSDPVQFSKMVG